jgi:predicted HicB family RNase H-like nuclease
MSRLTVRLPESLHEQLSRQADREGVSLSTVANGSSLRAEGR